MPRKENFEERPISSRRLEAFTDGVFAIAATLLVLDLSVDTLGKGIHTDAELWKALGGMSNEFLSFAISFLIMGLLWSVHTWQFEYVDHVTHTLATMNTIRLFGVVLVPFTTSLNSTYSELVLGRLLLPLNFLFVILLGTIQWYYATSSKRGLVTRLSPDEIRSTRIGSIAAVFSSVAVVILAPFFGPWAFFAFFLNFAFEAAAGRIRPPRLRRDDRPA
jgi:uncharacterized membrane protein